MESISVEEASSDVAEEMSAQDNQAKQQALVDQFQRLRMRLSSETKKVSPKLSAMETK